MDLATLDVDRAAAREAFLDYRKAFREQHQEIDGELMRGYKAIAGGKQLIRLSTTIAAGGVDPEGRPRLAIARADEPRVTFSRTQNGSVTFSPNINWSQRARSNDRVIRLGDGTLPQKTDGWINEGQWVAVMPLIPPKFRPPFNLENYHVLWEAVWTRGRVRAPHDPALLKRIGGDLFAVLAVWDLSPLEQAVLELRG
jgi:hypothetical protein